MFNKLLSTRTSFYPYSINYSCMFDSASSSYLHYSSGNSNYATNRKKAWCSFWIKRSSISIGSNTLPFISYADAGSNQGTFRINANDNFEIYSYISSSFDAQIITTAKFMDCSQWYHIFFTIDTTQATASDRIKMYVNGIRITDFSTEIYPALNATTYFGDWDYAEQAVAKFGYFDGYFAEFHYGCADGDFAMKTVTDFGSFKNGVWIPKKYTGGGYGTGGFYLPFSDASNLGANSEGHGNDFTVSGIGTDHQVSDTPTNNYSILVPEATNSNINLSEGGLKASSSAVTGWYTATTSFVIPETGKWYWEAKISAGNYTIIGITSKINDYIGYYYIAGSAYIGEHSQSYGFYSSTTEYKGYNNGSATSYSTSLGAASPNDVMQIAYDADSGKIWFGVNNTWAESGNPSEGTNEQYSGIDTVDVVPGICLYGNSSTAQMNFGQSDFAYTPPTGFNELCSSNLPLPTVFPTNDVFDVVLYAGDGATTHAVNSLSFSPNFVWIKDRSVIKSHRVADTVRGTGKSIETNLADAELSQSNTFKSFDSNGFTVGDHSAYNASGDDYVAYCIKKGATYGFDIVSWSGDGVAGRTVSHSLGDTPELIIVKNRDSAYNWRIYHWAVLNYTDPETDAGYLNLNNTWIDTNLVWNDTAPTSTEFTVGTGSSVNTSGDNYIGYLFVSIPGFSRVFKYIGNANTDGPYVFTDFRPRWIMFKNASYTNDWRLYDAERNPYNGFSLLKVLPDSNAAESSGDGVSINIYSNGFKIKVTDNYINRNGDYFVGVAFAEMPFKYSNAR